MNLSIEELQALNEIPLENQDKYDTTYTIAEIQYLQHDIGVNNIYFYDGIFYRNFEKAYLYMLKDVLLFSKGKNYIVSDDKFTSQAVSPSGDSREFEILEIPIVD